jgi:hypothetical protein
MAPQRCALCAPSSGADPAGIVQAPGGPVALSVVGCNGGLVTTQTTSTPSSTRPARFFQQLGWLRPLGQLISILRVLSAFVMSRAPIRPFPTSPSMVP